MSVVYVKGSVPLAETCSENGCEERPIALAPFQESQMIFLCKEHADEITAAAEAEGLVDAVRWIVPTCRTIMKGSTTPCGAASTRVSVFLTGGDGSGRWSDWESACTCDHHTLPAGLHNIPTRRADA